MTALSGQVSDDEWSLEYRFPASVCGLEWATVKTAGVQFKLRRVVASAVLANSAHCGPLTLFPYCLSPCRHAVWLPGYKATGLTEMTFALS